MATKHLDHDSARKRLLSMPPDRRAVVLRNCGDWRHTVQHVLLQDMALDRYGKRFNCHAPAMLSIALGRLGRAMDMNGLA